jgi:F420-non-reducing hydrogenase small subunit
MSEKPKLAMYWAASCGGCEISLVNMNEKILDVDANFDFIFCPCLLDTKKKNIEAMPDKSIAITLFNGAIRTEENLGIPGCFGFSAIVPGIQ